MRTADSVTALERQAAALAHQKELYAFAQEKGIALPRTGEYLRRRELLLAEPRHDATQRLHTVDLLAAASRDFRSVLMKDIAALGENHGPLHAGAAAATKP